MRIIPESRLRASVLALPLSFAMHAALAAALIVLPLLRPGSLPRLDVTRAFWAPAAVVPLPPPPPPSAARGAKRKIGRLSPAPLNSSRAEGKIIAPFKIPSGIEDERIIGDGIDGGMPGGVPGGVPGGIYGGVVGNVLEAVVGDVLAPVAAIGDVKTPRLVKRVEPAYPDLARESRVEGIVIIEARTDIYGRVERVRLLRSIPLLDGAALEAVRQWVYEPMIVNGRPRGVIFTVTVRFALK